MCGDALNYGATLKELEEAGVELVHYDIMDNHFVPNLMLPAELIPKLRKGTKMPFDIHIMAENPESIIEKLELFEGDYVAVHYEACTHHQAMLQKIKSKGGKTMLALNPGTPLCVLEELLPDLDAVLVMTVNPGFAGQKLIPQTLDKITRCRKMLDDAGYPNIEIECDGNVSFENAEKMSRAGANIFVAGTSSLYAKGSSLEENIARMRKSIEI
jgi:ribulose-phosphate 3-epimerase